MLRYKLLLFSAKMIIHQQDTQLHFATRRFYSYISGIYLQPVKWKDLLLNKI
jgi:hypothetical protein